MKNYFKINKKLRSQKGAAMLLLVLVLTIAGLSMALASTELGLDDATMSYTIARNEETLSLAEGCLEDAMEHIRDNFKFK